MWQGMRWRNFKRLFTAGSYFFLFGICNLVNRGITVDGGSLHTHG
jgi:hypothetical protein